MRASRPGLSKDPGKEALAVKGRGKLTVFGRRLLVDRVMRLGYPVAQAAAMQGISAGCAYRWLRRWRAEGEAGLEDRSCRPHRSRAPGQP